MCLSSLTFLRSADYENFFIKCGLDSIFKENISPELKNAFKETINEFVIPISAWMVEAGFLIFYYLSAVLSSNNPRLINDEFTKKKTNMNLFTPFFNALKANTNGRNALNRLCPFHVLLRQRANYSGGFNEAYIGNAINSASQLYRTNFMNNIVVHGRSRIYRFLPWIFSSTQQPNLHRIQTCCHR